MENTLRTILHYNFDVPLDIGNTADLRSYLLDSIDVGELVAILNNTFNIQLRLIDLKDIYTCQELTVLLKEHVSTSQ